MQLNILLDTVRKTVRIKDLLKAVHYVILLMSSEDEELIKQQTDPSHNQWGVNGEPKEDTIMAKVETDVYTFKDDVGKNLYRKKTYYTLVVEQDVLAKDKDEADQKFLDHGGLDHSKIVKDLAQTSDGVETYICGSLTMLIQIQQSMLVR